MNAEVWQAGKTPWKPFQLVSAWPLPERKITDQTLGLLGYATFSSEAARNVATKNAIAVLVASRAINKMMGKPETTGMYPTLEG